ncbi:PIN domain-containing protein [Inquilinus sp. OTU3971]|uniref:PIN domain-containing protein n=1 Tax=Inquilinus sp. OTU3971 TaxID=3043855 RepID=UPI00313D8457
MKVALDTNILAYAEGVNGADRAAAARGLVQKLPADAVALPVQVLGELFHVLVRKAKWTPDAARTAILSWHDAFAIIDTSMGIMAAAADLAHDHQLVIWDAVILAAAAEGSCRLLLSEDLQDGFTWRGVTVANPFAPTLHALLEAFLAD